jgi:hypothetical protein
MTEFEICLYCDEPTGSLEHVLASGLGGRFTTETLICGRHNGLCGQWADDPLAKQFEYAIHCLEVLKGDGTRGTTWHGLVAEDGQRFDMLPDFTAKMRPLVEETDEGGKRLVGTHPEWFEKIEKRLSAKYDFTGSFSEIRSNEFRPTCNTHGPGMRGILKAAFHFVATQAAHADEARAAAKVIATALYTDVIPSCVKVQSYDVSKRRGSTHFHELTAWNDGEDTLVLVNVFNIVNYIVVLPYICITPTRYCQAIKTWERVVERCDIPSGKWYGRETGAEDFEKEYALRVDLVVALGQSKSDIADIIRDRAKHSDFDALREDEQIAALYDAVKVGFRYPMNRIPPWFLGDVEEFKERRILATVNENGSPL